MLRHRRLAAQLVTPSTSHALVQLRDLIDRARPRHWLGQPFLLWPLQIIGVKPVGEWQHEVKANASLQWLKAQRTSEERLETRSCYDVLSKLKSSLSEQNHLCCNSARTHLEYEP